MKTKKLNLIKILLFLSIILNLFQLGNLRKEEDINKDIDIEFKVSLQSIYNSINYFYPSDKDLGLVTLSSSIGRADALCRFTSFNNENVHLYRAIFTFNNLINNNSNFKTSLEKIDFSKLEILILELYENPLNEDVAKELLDFCNSFF